VTEVLRVLRSGKLSPAANMALDERLLDAAGAPLLRIYGWAPPGLSLGRFQDPTDFADVDPARVGPFELVRRVTGGGAIWHEHEITFALTVDARWLPGDVGASYALVHGAAVRALADVSVPARMLPGTGLPVGARPTQRWCFAEPGAFDVVLPSGRKVLGSAQRRVRRPIERILHHGSLVLRAPKPTPFCGSVAEHVDPDATHARLVDALVEAIAAALSLHPSQIATADP
jgi:lipoate-protein ligase A